MKTIVKLAFISLALMLGGCVSDGGGSGSKFDPAYLSQNLISGKTTQAEVQQKFGAPSSTSSDSDGTDYWYYKSQTLSGLPSVGGVNPLNPLASVGLDGTVSEKRSSLQVVFKRGIVRSYSLSR